MGCKFDIFINCFKLVDSLSFNKQITVTTFAMKTQAKFSFCLTKINTKLFKIFSSLFFPILVAPNQQNFNVKFLSRLFDQLSKS